MAGEQQQQPWQGPFNTPAGYYYLPSPLAPLPGTSQPTEAPPAALHKSECKVAGGGPKKVP